MKFFKGMTATAIALGLGLSGSVAMPSGPQPAPSSDLVIKVQEDCHADVRRHFLPEYGQRLWHRHRSNCRVVLTDPEDDEDDEPRDCHRDVRRHYLPQYDSRVTHRHVGNNCRVRVYRPSDDRDPDGTCIRIGPITYCER